MVNILINLINGFKETRLQLKNETFQNIVLPENASIVINDAENINFKNVATTVQAKPKYSIANSKKISY